MSPVSRITRTPETQFEAARNAKSALRPLLLARRRALDGATRSSWDGALAAHLLAWCAARQTSELGVYWPLAGEPDLHPAYAALAARGVVLALPVVLEQDAALAFTAWTPGEAMTQDAMGVAVPARLRLVACPATLLVPCLGFNPTRFRLGYGGGYYDRTLAVLPRPVTLGLAYACQSAEFASASHDIALDAILTEAGVC